MSRPRQLKPCGTNAGYQRHRKRGEAVCDACREATRIMAIDYRLKRKGQKRPRTSVADIWAVKNVLAAIDELLPDDAPLSAIAAVEHLRFCFEGRIANFCTTQEKSTK